MSGLRYRFFPRFLRQQEGSVAVEFALLVPLLLILLFGIVDFGHAWYVRQELVYASREGARYGTRFHTVNSVHVLPNALDPTIASYVTSKYTSLLPPDANLQVTPGGTGYATGVVGDPLTVTVTATKTWWLVSKLVPGLNSSINLSASTEMQVE
jgi:Flp pilus assembly protein TadG